MFKNIFLTGFPGFIGHRLIKELLQETEQVHCLVQSHMMEQAREEAGNLTREMELSPEKIRLYPGDITRKNLGLSAENYRLLTNCTTHVFHLAAVYDLGVSEELARKVNVEGTRNINKFCLDCEKLERHIYFSTCYVSGNCEGTFYEEDLEKGQDFKNYYESTKHQAEVEVRKKQGQIPTTIIRPAIVVGDSVTGEINKFDGPYFIMTFVRRFGRLPLPYIGRGEAEFNLVPVDFLVRATLTLARKNTAGETFQIADPSPYTVREVYGEIAHQIAGSKPRFTLPEKPVIAIHHLPFISGLTGIEAKAFDYLNHQVKYDTTNLEKYLDPEGIKCPDFFQYLPNLIRFFRENSGERSFLRPARERVRS